MKINNFVEIQTLIKYHLSYCYDSNLIDKTFWFDQLIRNNSITIHSNNYYSTIVYDLWGTSFKKKKKFLKVL